MDFPPENIKDRLIDFLEKENIRDNLAIKISIGVFLIVIGVMMFPHPESLEYRFNVGAVWVDKDLVAPFAFPIYKDLRQYEHERQNAIKSVYPVFEINDSIIQSVNDSLASSLSILTRGVIAYGRLLKSHLPDDSTQFNYAMISLPFTLTKDEWGYLSRFQELKKKNGINIFQKFEREIASSFGEVYRNGVIDRVKKKDSHAYVALRRNVAEELIPYEKVYDTEEALRVIASRLTTSYGETPEEEIAVKIAREILRPNIQFDQTATYEAIQIADENVPRTLGFVRENERIISKHERVTEENKLKLDSFRRAKTERGMNLNNWKHWVGAATHVSIILSLFALYLGLFRKKIFHDNGKLMLIGLLILLEIIFAYLTLVVNFQGPVQYLIFVPVASMLLAIIFDTRVAFYGTVTIAFLVAGIRGNDYTIALASIVAGALGAYTVRDIRSRTQIFWSMIYIFIGYVVAILALSLEQLDNSIQMLTEVSYALANAVFSPIITYALLLLFERVFKVTTDMTMAELADFNHPLLMELSDKAPGTFHHSVTIGNLAEAAAEDIGANAILARVGGYYHDIGKLLKPEYFIENQVGPHSRHNRLKPRMSALIISAHVREGVELGRERGLPEVVLDFIPQHHGTTRISFFFDKALKQAAKRPQKDAIREEDFLYPGPKPQTKEAGIVMLADSVEAATRTINEMTPQKLEAAIDNMIKHRFMEGQLDECELTLRDLTKIKEAFLKILIGIHHQRIKYPEQQHEESSAGVTKTEEQLSEKEPVHDVPTIEMVEDVPGVSVAPAEQNESGTTHAININEELKNQENPTRQDQ